MNNHEIQEDSVVPFTARLMAYYRSQENKSENPLIMDPFAERLVGDISDYAKKHKYSVGRGDYSIVRSYYIEKYLLTHWCKSQVKSQIILLGAGLDTRAYRFLPLKENNHILFEIDLPVIVHYKEKILKREKPYCRLIRISKDLSDPDLISTLMIKGYSREIPTFWVLEGLIYYMDQLVVASLLTKISNSSMKNSQIFADVCIPILAEVKFGPFMRHFKWGLEKEAVPAFFARSGWNVSCSWADDYDQGRDVGQKGLIFIHGIIT